MRNKNYIQHLNRLVARIILVIAVVFCAEKSFAQQDPMYTQYMENLQTVNPAYAGSKDLLNVMVVARNQWVSLPGAPDTRTLAAHTPIANSNMGIGLSILSDQIGPVKQTGIYVDYSYRLQLSQTAMLNLGFKGGINFYDARISTLKTNDPNDPVFASDINRDFLPNLGVGAFFYTNRYYCGLSLPKLIENSINKNGVSVSNISKEQLHLFFMAGYVFDVNRIVKFKPSILAKYVKNAPVSVDLNGTFLFYDRLWLGAMFRFGDSVGGMLQLQVTNQIKVGYSYDFPISQLGAYNNGTHEIMVSFDINPGGVRVRSPRYF